jgi:hypothetical protein
LVDWGGLSELVIQAVPFFNDFPLGAAFEKAHRNIESISIV